MHVVGTNGKSTATITIEQLLLADGLSVGATVSPHVRSWSERIRVNGRDANLEAALARIRSEAEQVEATQFETITAAALTAFAEARWTWRSSKPASEAVTMRPTCSARGSCC